MLQLEDGLSARFGIGKAIRKKVNRVMSSKVASFTPAGQLYRAATGQNKKLNFVRNKIGKKIFNSVPDSSQIQRNRKTGSVRVYDGIKPKRRIMYNPKNGNCYTLREDSDLSAAPLILAGVSLAKKAIQSPGGQKLIGSVFKKKAPAATSAVQSVGLNAELQQKVKSLMIENKNLKTNLQTTEAAKNAMAQQRYYFGGGGFLAGAVAGYMFKR